MKKENIIKLIILKVNDSFEEESIKTIVTTETPLFGRNSEIDSMGLVNLIVDIESYFLEKGYDISLTSEKAMSRNHSPFRSIISLAEFIEEQILLNIKS